MTTTATNVHQSKWGFHAYDRETHKKIKRIRHLVEKCKSRNNRFKWYWRKEPQNRFLKQYESRGVYKKVPIAEPALFERFFEKVSQPTYIANTRTGQNLYTIRTTDAYNAFMKAHAINRQVYQNADDVPAATVSPQDIDEILTELETYLA